VTRAPEVPDDGVGGVSADPHLARWNARFAAAGYHFGTEPNEFLVSQGDLIRPGMTALALADGEGRDGVWLAAQGLDVLSVDFSPVGLEKARRLAAERGVALRTEVADLTLWNWPEARFDLVIAIFIQFASPPVRARLFDGIRRALKPEGLFMLQGYGVRQPSYGTGGPSQVGLLYSAQMLRDAFSDWEILRLAEHEAVLNEGRAHVGRSAVVDIVVRKPAAR
jgi:SAM-dependent methyltransferase